MTRALSVEDVKNRIWARTEGSSLRKVAKELGVSAAYLSDVMRGNRNISHKLAERLGFKMKVVVIKTVTFEELKCDQNRQS